MTTPKEYHNIQLKNITLTYLLERKLGKEHQPSHQVRRLRLRVGKQQSPGVRDRGFYYRKAELHRAGNPGVFEEEYAGVSIKTICRRRNLRLSGEKPVLKSQRGRDRAGRDGRTVFVPIFKTNRKFYKKGAGWYNSGSKNRPCRCFLRS